MMNCLKCTKPIVVANDRYEIHRIPGGVIGGGEYCLNSRLFYHRRKPADRALADMPPPKPHWQLQLIADQLNNYNDMLGYKGVWKWSALTTSLLEEAFIYTEKEIEKLDKGNQSLKTWLFLWNRDIGRALQEMQTTGKRVVF